MKFFFKHSYRDVGRRQCHFCLSFCSVLIVVWSALVINTLVEKGPQSTQTFQKCINFSCMQAAPILAKPTIY